MTSQHRFGRREALVGLGATAVGTAAVAPSLVGGLAGRDERAVEAPEAVATDAVTTNAEAPGPALPPASDEVRALFGPLTEGSPIATHWRLESVHGVREGAIPVVMSTLHGERFAVEIFRDAAHGPTPIARADGLALCLVNGGNGGSSTSELAGLGVVALGRALEARRREAAIPSGLLTQRERMVRNANGMFDVPV